MKVQIASYLLCIAVGFLLALTIITPKTETKILKGVSTTTVDTIYVDKLYPKIITKEVPKLVPKYITKLDTVYLVNSMNHYRDTVKMEENYHITYNAATTGTLDYISLTSIDNRVDRVINKTTTIVEQPGGLFIGGTTNINLTSNVGAIYVKDRNIVGVSVNLNTSTFTTPSKYNFTYYRKLF
jgi:hypothetical protein